MMNGWMRKRVANSAGAYGVVQRAAARVTGRWPTSLLASIVGAAIIVGILFTAFSSASTSATQPALMAFSENNGFAQLSVKNGHVVPLMPKPILSESQVISNIAVDNRGASPTYYILGIGNNQGEQMADAVGQPDAVAASFDTTDRTAATSPSLKNHSAKHDPVVYLQSWQQSGRVDLIEVEDNGLLGHTCISMHFDQRSQQLVLWSWLPPATHGSPKVQGNSARPAPVVNDYLGTVAHIDPSGKFTVVYQSDLIAPLGATRTGSMRACHSRWNPQTASLAVMAQTPDQRAVRQIHFRIRPSVAISCDRTYPNQPGVLTGEEQISSDNTGRLYWIPTAINNNVARGVFSFAPNSCEQSTQPEFITSLPAMFQHKFGRCQTVIANDHERLLAVVIGPESATAANLLTLDLDSGQVVDAPAVKLHDAQALGNCVAVQ